MKANNANFDELKIDSQDPKTSTPKPPNVKIGTECDTPTRPHRIRSNRRRRQKKNRMSESEKKELNDSLKVFERSRSKSRSESQLELQTLEDVSSKSRNKIYDKSL